MGHKLSILPRSSDKTGWHQSSQFKVEEIQAIKVDGAGVNKSLNSIPSPFARMHLFETAVQMVYQDLIQHTRLAGETYNKMVSDCLDVFELIYYWDTHVKEGKPLQFATWKKDEEIRDLVDSRNKSHNLLGRTLQTFLDSDPAFADFDKCLIIKYNGKVIAGSSPFTGFFTTPDALDGFNLLKPLSQIAYFSRTIPFNERKGDVKKYIYDFFEGNPELRNDATASIRSFLELYQSSIPDTPLSLQTIVAGGAEMRIFGRTLDTAKGVGTQLFEQQIVKLNYRLNEDCFYLPRSSNSGRTHDYLLPLSAAFFEQFEPHQIPDLVTITEQEPGTVEVSIEISRGKKISKKYQERHLFDQDGRILDLYEKHQINFNLGIFPFLKITGQPEGAEGFNDFYRVVTTIQDLHYKYSNKDFNLRFGKDRHLLESGDLITISRTDRTIFSDKTDVGSTFYAINSCFDFLQTDFPAIEADNPIKATLAPKWKEKIVGNKQMDFSIDFGTTSTFIAFTDDPAHNKEPRPFEFDEKELPVALLNKPREKKPGNSLIEFMELFPQFPMSIEVQRQEFIPSIIKRKEKYQFPIRTVLFQQQSIAPGQKNVLANANISFVYQKPKNASSYFENQEYKTNLKWNINTISDFKGSIKVFIEELFLLIRTKILLNEGDPRKSRIYWFYPLSFSPALKKSYTDLWLESSKKYLKSPTNNISSLTESEAPYHFLFKQSKIDNSRTVLTVDIGGGSTDIMVFNGNKPVFGTSVYFGANVLWGNGYAFSAGKTNGIYQEIRQEMTERLNSTLLKKMNEDYNSEANAAFGSDEIINFWIANDNETDVINRLKSGDFKLSYLLHLSALVYHTLKLLKFNQKDAEPPTCVVFSGNGSKYIDLIHNARAIERIWGYFARKIFGPDAKDPQVILPESDRKEATCYGGLSMSSQPAPVSTENYLGFEKPGEKGNFTYSYLATHKDDIFSRLLESFSEFVEWFFGMNQVKELNFRNEFGIEKKPEPFKRFLLEKAEENLHEGYLKRSELVSPEDPISDSLFYYPLVGLIYKINKLTSKQLYDLTEKTALYASSPDGEKEFDSIRLTTEQRPDSIFTLTFENNAPDFAVVSIIDDPAVHKRTLLIYQDYLDPICTYTVHPEPGQSIRVITPGRAKRQGDKWLVEEKIQIEFV